MDACNQGAAAARGECVLFLNNDVVVLPGWLDSLLRTLDRDRSIGAVGAMLIYPDGRLQEAGAIIWRDGLGWNYGRLNDPEASEFSFVREVDYCSAACLLVRRALFEELAGFDIRYAPAYCEDVDLCFRMRERGYRVLYQPQARVIHFEGATAGTDMSSGFKRYQTINHAKFVERHALALAEQQPHDPRLVRLARARRSGRRILVVDHMVPHHDEDAGSLRMLALLRMLIELGHAVTFIPDNMARIEPYTSELQQLGIEVLYGGISALEFVESNADLFDVAILCRAYFAAKYLPALQTSQRRPFIIFDTVDLHHLRERAFGRAQRRCRARTIGGPDASRRIRRHAFERRCLGHEHARGRAVEPRARPLQVEIVPAVHAVRTDVPSFGERRDILFIGSFRHPPNEDAVIYFVAEILPRVRRALPGVQFFIVGPHAPRSVLKLASDDVVVLGHTRAVEPVFDSCRLSVAPLRYGAGVKGKVTQSLAWGLPAVVTPVAAEGLQLVDGEHLLVASDPIDFANRVVEVYQNEELWTRLARNGRRHIETHLGYEAVRASVRSILERASREGQVPLLR